MFLDSGSQVLEADLRRKQGLLDYGRLPACKGPFGYDVAGWDLPCLARWMMKSMCEAVGPLSVYVVWLYTCCICIGGHRVPSGPVFSASRHAEALNRLEDLGSASKYVGSSNEDDSVHVLALRLGGNEASLPSTSALRLLLDTARPSSCRISPFVSPSGLPTFARLLLLTF